MIHDITPIPAPRMTRADRWKKRPPVLRYFAFKDRVKKLGIKVNNGDSVTFYMPMPQSWSKKKKDEMQLKPHQSRPDLDNLLKALLDSIYEDDAHIYSLRIRKFWDYEGSIEIKQKGQLSPD